MKPQLVVRAEATQATLERFRDRPLKFCLDDCARMVAFHLRAMGYHPGLARGGTYSTIRGAKSALKRAGFDSMGEWIDSIGPLRISPAEVLTGDLMQTEGDFLTAALVIYVGNGRVFGFHGETGTAVVMQPTKPLARAWRT